MSLNISIIASKKVVNEVSGKKGRKITTRKVDEFYAMQTPTTVTREILKSPEPISEYVKWVLNQPLDEDVILLHIESLMEWVRSHEEDGYTIEVKQG